MCNPALAVMAVSAVVSANAARNAAKGQQQSLLHDAQTSDRAAVTADNSAKVSDNNAALAAFQARDAIRNGRLQAGEEMRAGTAALDQNREQAAQVKARQKVSLAANGIDVGEGSATDILASTDYVKTVNDMNIEDATARNMVNIHDNALRAAWGYRTQGTSYSDTAGAQRADAALYRFDAGQQRGAASAINPNKAAFVSLIGNASQVAGSWYSMNKAGG